MPPVNETHEAVRHANHAVQGRLSALLRGLRVLVALVSGEPADTAPGWHDPAAQASRRKKTSTLRDKFHQLESQVQNIYGLLQTAPNEGSESSSQAYALEEGATTEADVTQQNIFDADDVQIPDQSLSLTAPFAPVNPDAPSDVLAEVVGIYSKIVHLQPLPLFRPHELLHYMESSSRYLCDSFLALGLSLKAQIAHLPTESEITESYACCAKDEVRDLASQGIATLQVIQSLCLLALRDILVCKPFQAQMTIGTASRLEACRSAVNDTMPQPIDVDLSLRCSWSVYILERTFSPRLCISVEEIPGPNFPQSANIPPTPASTRHEEYPSDLYNSYSVSTDYGITAYYIRMLSNWGHISLWLHHIRMANPESPSLPESKYARLIARVYECDSHLPAAHLLRNVAFSKRTSTEIIQQREYWIPWVLMQVECHAYLSILNHPFIHLVAVRNCSKGLQSGIFLQHTVDAAIFHSGWVFHFLRLCDEHQLELHDPFIGDLVAVVGTIPWLLQFVEDSKVSQKANNDFVWCSMYLSRISGTWPHLNQKLEIIQSLQLIAEHYRQGAQDNGRGVTFPPGLLWELLDPDVCHGRYQRGGPEQAHQAKIQITTHMTHPLADSSTSRTTNIPTSDFTTTFDENANDLEQVYVEDLVSHFMLYNSHGQVE